MPITLPNFLNAPILQHPDYAKEVEKGMKLSQLPAMLRDEAMKRKLMNDFAAMQNEFYPKVQQQNLDIGDVNLQSGKLNLGALPQQLQDEAAKRGLGMEQTKMDMALAPLRQKLLNAQIGAQEASAKKRQFESDPAAQIQYMQQLLSSLGSGGIGGQGGVDAESLSPLQLSVIKKATGLDLTPKESPEQKRERDMEAFIQKEEIKRQNKAVTDLTQPTKATITSNQSVITAANNIIPQIKQLKNMAIPNQATGKFTSPNQNQKYEAMSNAIADGLMAAFGWPKTDQALHMAKQLVKRGALESESAYKQRLDGLISELEERRNSSHEILSSSSIKPKVENSSKPVKGRINGKEVEVHPSRVDQFLSQGGTLL